MSLNAICLDVHMTRGNLDTEMHMWGVPWEDEDRGRDDASISPGMPVWLKHHHHHHQNLNVRHRIDFS